MGKINLEKFDKLVAEQQLLVDQSEQHSLDSTIKIQMLLMLKDIDKLIERPKKETVKETVKVSKSAPKEVKAPQPELPEVDKTKVKEN